MTAQDIFTYIVGPIITFLTFVITKFLEKKKWQKQLESDEIKNVQSIIDIYRQTVDDLKKELAEQSTKLSDISLQLTKLQKEYEELKKLNNDLKKSLNKQQNG